MDRPKADKPKVTTVGQDWQMTLTYRRRRFKTAIEYDISSQTSVTLTYRSGIKRTNATIRLTRSK